MLSFWLFLFLFVVTSGHPIQKRILNGQLTDIKDHPWMVAIYDMDNCFKSGGFLISPRWVITAGHVIWKLNIKKICAGSSYSYNQDNCVDVSEKIIHPDLLITSTTILNDIALLGLSESVKGNNIEPVNLPEPYSQLEVGTTVFLTGWGLTNINMETEAAEMLQKSTMEIIDIEMCQLIFLMKGLLLSSKGAICGGNSNELPYRGDSGGPVMVNKTVVGIISRGIRDSKNRNYPSAFTDISFYRQWILETTNL